VRLMPGWCAAQSPSQCRGAQRVNIGEECRRGRSQIPAASSNLLPLPD
jgi:hypothetical protein